MNTIEYRKLLDKMCTNCMPTGADVHKYMNMRAAIISGLKLIDIHIDRGNTNKAEEILGKVKLDIFNFAKTFPVNTTNCHYDTN